MRILAVSCYCLIAPRQPQADIVVGTFHVPSTNINQVRIELSRTAQREQDMCACEGV
jgi:hypothetical protein